MGLYEATVDTQNGEGIGILTVGYFYAKSREKVIKYVEKLKVYKEKKYSGLEVEEIPFIDLIEEYEVEPIKKL